jgi:hypothetical protein
MTDDWRPMDQAPRDGTPFTLLAKSKDGVEVIVLNIKYGHASMDKTKLILWGNQNFLSPYLEPLGWKPQESKGNVEQKGEKLLNKKKEINPEAVEPWDKTKHPYPI